MKKINERKLRVQEYLIEDLKKENKQLKDELENIKADLEIEKLFKDEEYDNLKELLVELNNTKSTYENLIQKAILVKKEYEEKTKEINELKVKYNKEMKSLYYI